MAATVALLQGCYFFLTGIWPILSIRTFQLVTGPKRDLWLVKTVGSVLAVIGAALVLAGARSEISPATALLAVGSAVALAAVDVNYVARKVISPVYLLDAAAEAVLVVAWGVALQLEGKF